MKVIVDGEVKCFVYGVVIVKGEWGLVDLDKRVYVVRGKEMKIKRIRFVLEMLG